MPRAIIAAGASTDTTDNADSISSFLDGWLIRQQNYLDELLSVQQRCNFGIESQIDYIRDLISRVLAHYQHYYEEKSRIAHRDIFLAFSPPWFTPFERTFLWIAGFKPGLAFRLVADSIDDLTEEQRWKMDCLRNETRQEEKELESELARVQESVAAPPVADLAKQTGGGPPVEGEIEDEETALGPVRAAMEEVLATADDLRTRTAERVVEILNPAQNLSFLAAAAQLQLRIRELGKQREAFQGVPIGS